MIVIRCLTQRLVTAVVIALGIAASAVAITSSALAHHSFAPLLNEDGEEVIEVIIHTAFYVGLPFVRAAMDIANETFRSE